MNPEAFNAIIKKPNIVQNWTRLSFKENYKIVQCFKCGKYGHIASKCRNEDFREGGGLCLRCGTMGHRERECTLEPKCMNCESHNSRFKTTYDVKHSARATDCKIRDKEVDANLDDDLVALQTVLLNNLQRKIIIFGDFNAKSPIWGKRGSDRRGQKLTDFINHNDLFVINKSDSLPTFNSPQGVSWIDLALSLNIHPDRLQNWNITDRLTLSDHNIMELTVMVDPQLNIKKTRKWKLCELKFWKFKELLNIFLKKGFEVGGDLDHLIDQIQQGLLDICFKTRKTRTHHQQNAVWWNQELESMRSLVRALRRRYQKTYEASERLRKQIIFKKNLAIYVKKIALVKENSFRAFLGNTVKVYTFDSFYKMVKRNYNISGGVQRVLKETGELTCSLKESMQVILEHFFPRLEINFISNQIVYGDKYLTFPEVTEIEVRKILSSSSNDKAPGPDGLTLGIIKELFDSNKDLFINIMNSSLSLGYFLHVGKRRG
ncbi:hypothetical protein AVEN_222283-1 [Araneus ventricosus]|uniref:CCHC-type domain-containing protein n=1 Tax=Araneus ventricosus TaxID=182803 RepID=A0A4Y2T8T5_ARAVE|nr:hypothetical protein AVEN_222283-1 [Araneus ventricosus]